MKNDFICLGSKNATYRLICLHGWGADGTDLVPFGEELLKLLDIEVQLLFLNAPELHPDGNGRQWYRLFPADWSKVPNAIKNLQDRLNKHSSSSIPLSNTFLLGFSQGGAMALAAGCDFPLAGLICCSAYPHPGWEPNKKCPPIFLSHGEFDQVVPIEASRKISNLLKDNDLLFNLFTFKGEHEITKDVTFKISLFIKGCLLNIKNSI